MSQMHHILILVACIGLGVGFSYWRLRKSPIGALQIISCVLAMVVVGSFGSKVFAFMLRNIPFATVNWDIFMSSGLRHPGSIISLLLLMPVVLFLLVPKGWRLQAADTLAMAMLLCLPLYRIICHVNGCCIGGVCDQGYCIDYPAMSAVYLDQVRAGLIVPGVVHSLAVFPLHAFIAFSSALSFIILLCFDRYKDYPGQLVLLFLVLNEGLKAVLESWRVPYIAELQWASALLAVVGLLGLIVFGWWHHRQYTGVKS